MKMCNGMLIISIFVFLVPIHLFCHSLPLTASTDVALSDRQMDYVMNCASCKRMVQTLQSVWNQNLTRIERAVEIAKMCNELQMAPPILCGSVMTVMKDEILYIIDELLKAPRQQCQRSRSIHIKGCGVPNTLLNTTWMVNIPANKPEAQEPAPPMTGSPTLRVLHMADIHFDPAYLPGSEVQCAIPLCCRDNRPYNLTPNYPIKQAAGYWGSFGACDIPLHTVENLFIHLNNSFQFDAIYWTGDVIPHNVWNQSRASNMKIYQNLTQLLIKYFPNKRIFSAVGNHESAPANSFAASNLNLPPNLNTRWLYEGLAKNWLTWLPNDTEQSIKLRGSYVTRPYPGLTIVSVNSNACYTANYWLFLYNADPDGTLQWLSDQLYQAEMDGDKVHIIGHVPPGYSCSPPWSKNYYNIINRFENTIRGQFFGHTHLDGFAVFYEGGRRDGRATSFYSVGPSLTTFERSQTKMNPGFKIYTIDGNYSNSSWSLLDVESYWMNLTEANLAGHQPQWKLLYRTKDSYHMNSLLPKDWSDLINRFKSNNALLDAYINHENRHANWACVKSASCRLKTLCAMRSATTEPTDHLCDDLYKRDAAKATAIQSALLFTSLILSYCLSVY